MRWALLVLGLVLSGCKKEEVQVYRIPKEAPSPARRTEGGSPSPVGRGLNWTAPKGWQELPGSGMRAATFKVPGGAELSVTTFPGDAGGELANVNRWRGQIGLAPVDETALASQAQTVASKAGKVLVVDYSGKTSRLLAGILNTNGNSWFFKLTGTDAAVGAARPAFLDFLRSVHP